MGKCGFYDMCHKWYIVISLPSWVASIVHKMRYGKLLRDE